MDVRAVSANIASYTTDAIITYLFEDAQAGTLDTALNGAIQALIEAGDFSGKTGQVAVLYPRETIPSRRVILVGLGKPETFTVDIARRAAASGILKARDLKVSHAAMLLDDALSSALGIEVAAQAVTEGSLMALYNYRGQKTGETPETLPVSLDVIVDDHTHDRAAVGILAGTAIGEGVNLARDLVNLPPNICTPEYLANRAQIMADEFGLACQLLGKTEMEALSMGAILGVAQGSDTPPRFIILEHNAARDDLATLVLVGKGVTFDTGGYNIKTTEGMGSMKGDMAGGAAVIGAMRALAGLDVPLHVVGLVPASDNMISGHAYRAQEVLTASNGVTIEIISTDAEGRLLLADALVYAGRYNPTAVVDIATLTGACVTALGANVAAGLFSIDDGLRDQLLAAGTSTAEKVWPLPLFPEYDKTIESNTADIKNSGGARGGVGTSAIFLKHFTDYPAWAHIDMAGMMFDQPDNPCYPKGATGYGVRLLTEFVRRAAMG